MTKPEQILQDMALYNAPDVRRIEHAMKVYAWASLFGVQEGLSERGLYTLRLAAALHDIGIHEAEKKHHSSAGVYQELEGPAIARQLLSLREVPAPVIERVCHLIGRHHTYTDIDGPDCQLLIEADFMVNIEEDALGRDAVEAIREKIFRSQTGIQALEAMYLGRMPA